MKNRILCVAAFCAMMLTVSCTGLNQAVSTNTNQGGNNGDFLGQLLGSNAAGGALGNIIEGVFTQTNLNVADLAGQWTSTGSAVSFQSENFLAKAGGMAAAGAIESQLDPYFKQYGLTGAVFNINTDGSFTLTAKGMTIGGTITKAKDGNFVFNFQAMGLLNLGKINAYVTKSMNNMNIMFDASKLKSLLGTLAQFSGSQLASTAVSVLNNYEGMMVGFKLNKTGNATQTNGRQNQNQNQNAGTLLDNLLKR